MFQNYHENLHKQFIPWVKSAPVTKSLLIAGALFPIAVKAASPLSSLLLAQVPVVVPVSQVQTELNAYFALPDSQRPPVFNLPNGYILCDRALKVPNGASNFTLRGGPFTQLIRTTETDIHLLECGSQAPFALYNSAFNTQPVYSLEPVNEGATTLVSSTSANIPTGYYVIYGDSPLPLDINPDVVSGPLADPYYFKRELIYVNNTDGVLTTGGPIGRSYESPKLARMSTTPELGDRDDVMVNVTLENIQFDGRFAGKLPVRLAQPRKAPNRLLHVGLGINVTLKNLHFRHFRYAGLKVNLCRTVLMEDCTIEGYLPPGPSYGAELLANRYVTVRNCRFETTRLGIATGVGTSDLLVQDVYGGSGVGFDLSHGQGERNITYQRVIADNFQVGNTTWPRLSENLSLLNCSARIQIDLKGPVRNILISGRYTDTSVTPNVRYPTAPRVAFFTARYGSKVTNGAQAYPKGTFAPDNVSIQDAEFLMDSSNAVPPLPTAGFNLIGYSGVTYANPGETVVPIMKNVTFRNVSFKNLVDFSNRSSAMIWSSLSEQDLQPAGLWRFENCYIQNLNGFSPVADFGTVIGSGGYNLEFVSTRFQTSTPGGLAIARAVRFGVGSRGTALFDTCRFVEGVIDLPITGFPGDLSILNDGEVQLTIRP